mmetsp:Transcript_89488/g.191794  ORF Transcript_89488/g.191794 Transcript_89488/m.191794 type:complete len:91 (-) Transcript_89488:114-386(-)
MDGSGDQDPSPRSRFRGSGTHEGIASYWGDDSGMSTPSQQQIDEQLLHAEDFPDDGALRAALMSLEISRHAQICISSFPRFARAWKQRVQ